MLASRKPPHQVPPGAAALVSALSWALCLTLESLHRLSSTELRLLLDLWTKISYLDPSPLDLNDQPVLKGNLEHPSKDTCMCIIYIYIYTSFALLRPTMLLLTHKFKVAPHPTPPPMLDCLMLQVINAFFSGNLLCLSTSQCPLWL